MLTRSLRSTPITRSCEMSVSIWPLIILSCSLKLLSEKPWLNSLLRYVCSALGALSRLRGAFLLPA